MSSNRWMNHRRGSSPFRVRNELFLLRVRAACLKQASAHVVRIWHPLNQGWRGVKRRHHPVTWVHWAASTLTLRNQFGPSVYRQMGTHGGEANPPATVCWADLGLSCSRITPRCSAGCSPHAGGPSCWMPPRLRLPCVSRPARLERLSVERCELWLNSDNVNLLDAMKRPNNSYLLARFLRC